MNNRILLLAINQLKGKNFTIGNYQRGYKWSKKEILELLNDIHSYDDDKGIYCLQPIILKPISQSTEEVSFENQHYTIFSNNEVIDGQQRSTTLFILLKYLHYIGLVDKESLYQIDYQTRVRSGVFLNNHLDQIFELQTDSILESELLAKKYTDVEAVNNLWQSFISTNREFNNVDVYHFFVVSCYIKQWFTLILKTEENSQIFAERLLSKVKVIWYSLDDAKDNQNIINVFLNNNKGKISLTTSELIKALFILNIKNTEIQNLATLKINQFAIEWDHIEKKLQDDRFWYFIQPNSNLYVDGTRIDYLFDLHINHKGADKFYAYRHYELLFNENANLSHEWELIVQLYTKLVDWYNDTLIYHYLGFVTVSKIKTLSRILIESKGKTKEQLKNYLRKLIKDEFSKTLENEDKTKFFKYDLENLNYKDFYGETKKVLFLHNVLYYATNMAQHKFPFELYVKENWSIEHIIPQHPKDIEDVEIFKQWYADLILYNDTDAYRYSDILEDLDQYNSIEDIKSNHELKRKLDKIAEDLEYSTHKIDNLLLLDRNTNSSLGNNLYKDKRLKILKYDKNGKNEKNKPVFIPIETLNAFNKTFGEVINIENWSREDGEKYRKAISERLSDFLPKNN